MHQPPTKFEVRRRQTIGFSINRPGDLDLLTSNMVHIITHRMGNSPTVEDNSELGWKPISSTKPTTSFENILFKECIVLTYLLTYLLIYLLSGTFCYWLKGQHLSDRPRDLTTLTFNIGGHGACGWYGSSCSIWVPRLNFLGLPIRKMWYT